MAKRLPYRATTAAGNQFDFDFPIHPDTDSAVNVANLLSVVLAALDREVRQVGPVSNGEVLQALAMALAVRTRILPGPQDQLGELATGLVRDALQVRARPAEGNLEPGEPRDIH